MANLINCPLLFVVGLNLSALVGCDIGTYGDAKQDIIRTSHNEIAERFASDCKEASEYYQGKTVCLSGTVDAVYEFGTVVLVSDTVDHFSVAFAENARHELINMDVGDTLTVSCNKVSPLHIGDCQVMK